MIRLTADFDLQIKDLARFLDPVEICDADGNLIGLFVPANLERGRQIYEKLAKNLDRAEMERRVANANPGRTIQEVLQSLRDSDRKAGNNEAITPDNPRNAEKTECVTP